MTIESDTVTGPEWLASYVVNGDDSGLSETDLLMANEWIKNLLPWQIVSTEIDDDGNTESWFGICPITGLGSQLTSYVVHKEMNPTKKILLDTFPWLGDEENDHDLSGADVIDQLQNLFDTL